jgi:hypothetical protein
MLKKTSQTKVRSLEVPDFRDVGKTLEGPDLTQIDFEAKQIKTDQNETCDAQFDLGKTDYTPHLSGINLPIL